MRQLLRAAVLSVLATAGCSDSGKADPASGSGDENIGPSGCQGQGKCDIWGEDERTELYNVRDEEILKRARSTGSTVQDSSLERTDDGGATMPDTVPSLGQNRSLCEGEAFREEPCWSGCAGFFAGADIFVTAGHCVAYLSDPCATTSVVFGYGYWEKPDDFRSPLKKVAPDNLYHCKELLYLDYCKKDLWKTDFAILRLDRPVVGHEPLEFRTEGVITPGEGVYAIGNPMGLPLKVTPGGTVKDTIYTGQPNNSGEQPDNASGFFFDLDINHGNSGGPVFNAATGIVEGVVSSHSGSNYAKAGSCYKHGVCGVNVDCPFYSRAHPTTGYADVLRKALDGASMDEIQAIAPRTECPQ